MNDRVVGTLIIGGGYAGLNAYYSLKGNATVLSRSDEFRFWTAELRKVVEPKIATRTKVPFVEIGEVKDVDLSSRVVQVNGERIQATNLVIAPGCVRENLNEIMGESVKLSRVTLGSQDERDEYLVLQLAFYLKKLRKDVKVKTSYLKWLGEPLVSEVSALLEQAGIGTTESPDLVLDECTPPHPFSFYEVNQFLEVRQGIFAAGDIIKGWPKLGELAMRTGIYIGQRIREYVGEFKPIFIFILDDGRGTGLHVRSTFPWGGRQLSITKSRIRPLFKRFIERYYIWRKGNMGFLINL
ncbi:MULTISPECIES: FAD/NAD(P)-binding oxidoreductase [Metallosphaera]|uniref:FAD/NAD(P)-binding oxidoreductase n=1 Tax=Metallosphaera TaxID=41980 RepID=UPI001F069E2B|nr:FAD/NAD(P)-binding oxidoreductase [Metallosphaera sedula]MCH1770629.1 NAD(P)/FAD-dependent oxidoreductase [Metallosphaera sedula]MCP6728827.1 NAD(P)/FAD-dependent oxidoreductase [Metallosphaera sedula]